MRFTTDLALEACEYYKEQLPTEGVRVRRRAGQGYTVTTVDILSVAAAKLLGKDKGKYITIDFTGEPERSSAFYNALAKETAAALKRLLGKSRQGLGMAVGLGNRNLAPDALGPLTVEKLLISRHIFLLGGAGEDLGKLCAFTPGVLGLTGVESVESVTALVKKIRPDYVLAIDALAARSAEKMHASIQLSNAGISPGAGIGNLRKPLSREALGVPVIAVGVPMVVYAKTILYDFLESYAPYEQGLVPEIENAPAARLIVTPKDVDIAVKDCAGILAQGINMAVHNRLSPADLAEYLF